jgi:hypothetical protein
MSFLLSRLTRYHNLGRRFVFKGCRDVSRGIFVWRAFGNSSEFTHDFEGLEDEQPETREILKNLRHKHHYHGITEKQRKTHDVMVIEPDYKWGRHRLVLAYN